MRTSAVLLSAMVAGASAFAPRSLAAVRPTRPRAAALRLRGGASMITQEVLLTTVAPALGAVIANGMFLAPLAAVNKARKDGTLGDLNPLPFPAIIGNCVAWLAYGYTTKNPYVFASNAVGPLLGLWFTTTGIGLAKSAPERKKLEITTLAYVTAPPPLLSCSYYARACCCRYYEDNYHHYYYSYDDDDRHHRYQLTHPTPLRYAAVLIAGGWFAVTSPLGAPVVTGYIANALLLLYYSAPLSTMAEVIKTKSSKSILLPLSLLSLTNGLLWLGYGLAVKDFFIAVPNGIGVGLTGIQLLLKLVFRN